MSDPNITEQLVSAAEQGNKDEVIRLLNLGANIDGYSGDVFTALTMACYREHRDIAFILIERGADVNVGTRFMISPLMLACEKNLVDICQCLLDNGAHIHNRDNNGFTALGYAALNGCLSMVIALIEKNADMNDTANELGYNALHCAASTNKADIAHYLLSKGVDYKAVDKEGNTPLDLASDKGYTEIVDMIETFIYQDVDSNSNTVEETARKVAIENGQLKEKVEELSKSLELNQIYAEQNYLEWKGKIQKLKEENEVLKRKLDNLETSNISQQSPEYCNGIDDSVVEIQDSASNVAEQSSQTSPGPGSSTQKRMPELVTRLINKISKSCMEFAQEYTATTPKKIRLQFNENM